MHISCPIILHILDGIIGFFILTDSLRFCSLKVSTVRMLSIDKFIAIAIENFLYSLIFPLLLDLVFNLVLLLPTLFS